MTTKIYFTVMLLVLGVSGVASVLVGEIDRALMCLLAVLHLSVLFQLFNIGDTLDENFWCCSVVFV